MIVQDSKIYDAQSFEYFAKSFKDSFINSKKSRPLTDAAVASYGAYLEIQLTHIIPKVLTQKFPGLPAMEILPISNEGALEKLILRRMKSYSGAHTREIENKATAKGVITVGYSSTGLLVEDFEASSHYKEVDILRSAMLNDALDASLIEGHTRSYKTTVDSVAFLGMQNEAGATLVEGLLNNSLVDSSLTGNATASFSSQSGVAMYNDIKSLVATQHGKCGGEQTLHVDTLVTSPRVMSLLSTTTYGTSSTADYQNPKTIAEMIKTNLGITEIRATNHAAGLDTGTGGGDRICLFNRTPDVMMLSLPQPLKFSEVFKDCFDYRFKSLFRVAGLMINQKVGFAYLKGC